MNIKINWDCNQTNSVEIVNLEDLPNGGFTEREWNKLSNGEKYHILQDYIQTLPDKLYKIVTDYNLEPEI